ncbi:hypothetical protein ACLMJK_005283 [Lecanora helva]
MGDSRGSKPKSIPSWQRRESTNEERPPMTSDDDVSTSGQQPSQKQSLRQSAARFLEDQDVKDAPVEKEKQFLESKGLTEDDLQDILQEQDQGQGTPEAEVMEDYGIEKEKVQSTKAAPSTESNVPSSVVERASPYSKEKSHLSIEQSSSDSASKNVPPIITYPEFLLHSQRPPPLLTAHRLLNTLYIASGTAAAFYGASKNIVEPMIESLNAARHSLAETASTNITTLNSKLENAVSETPANIDEGREGDFSDVDSFDSDASRFFSRSAATQTSPEHFQSLSSTSSEAPAPTDLTQNHSDKLLSIQKKLSDLRSDDNIAPVQDSISDLQKFLQGLPHNISPAAKGKLWVKPSTDEYGKMKAEIRGMKGVLLSARNFPGGVSVR